MKAKSSISEKQVEKALVKKVESLGGKCWKFISPSRVGVPDRLCLMHKGKVAFIEVKKPGEKLRKIQIKRKNELEAMGFKVFVLDTIERIDEIIREIVGGKDDDLQTI